MVASIADKLMAMKAERDQVKNSTGRGLVVLKTAVVDAELDKLDLKLRTVDRPSRMVSPDAYDAGERRRCVVRHQSGDPPALKACG